MYFTEKLTTLAVERFSIVVDEEVSSFDQVDVKGRLIALACC